MFIKKLLATVASITLMTGALLGVSSPAFADDAVPAHDPTVTETITDTPAAAQESPAPASSPEPAVAAQPQPVVAVVPETPAPEPSAAAPVENPAAAEPAAAAARSSQPEQQSRPQNNAKVWVCKFVSSDNSPSGYQLKSGKQPIQMSINALGDDVNDTGSFNDRHPSFVVASDDVSLCSRTEVIVDEEVTCPTYQYGGIVNVTTSTKFFYGSAQVDFTQTQSTRPLTAGELRACDPPSTEVYVCQFVPSESHPSGWVVQEGAQPVLLAEGDLGPDVNDTGDFDPQAPSFIVASDDSSLCASKTVERSTEIMCPTVSSDGYATITTVRSFFYGSIKVKERTTENIRALTAQESSQCPPVVEPLVATAQADFAAATCNAPERLVLGPIVNATWGEITDPEGPNDYSVTATAHAGALFAPPAGPGLRAVGGLTTLTFSGILNPQLDPFDPECDLVTLGLVMPAVTFSQASCDVGGSYTLGVAAGYDPALVTFTVNGVSGIVAGTYPVAASGSVLVTVQVVEPNGLEFDWSDPPAFEFQTPSSDDCVAPEVVTAQLPTLAYTGGSGSAGAWWLLPLSMIVLGGAAIVVRRRMDAELH
ncbi:acid shock protein [Salinibacterium sp. NG22]|uniref:acid shock protein n=1 Tax=Salinibacterium sp. NG22 TaxID=2792040 RepID=UPI0018CF786C|nr:acid shock protein [Salinibacterium sp. NG22]MBH0109392.1 acid shock protein [Salinibacterium sp. NG22]